MDSGNRQDQGGIGPPGSHWLQGYSNRVCRDGTVSISESIEVYSDFYGKDTGYIRLLSVR